MLVVQRIGGFGARIEELSTSARTRQAYPSGVDRLARIWLALSHTHSPTTRRKGDERTGRNHHCTLALQPLYQLIEAHVLGAERLHGDDTTVPILAKARTITGHIWTYVRDDRPFGGHAHRPPSTTPQGIANRNIPDAIFEASQGSCRRTPIAATTVFTIPRGSQAQSRRRCAGAMQGVSSSSWPISLPMYGAGRRLR